METRLTELRKLLSKHNLNAYIVPSTDEHHNSWLLPEDKRREFISGFDGSAGLAVVTRNFALLWTDGRYWSQAKKQLGKSWTLVEDGRKGVPSLTKWLEDGLIKGQHSGASHHFAEKHGEEKESHNEKNHDKHKHKKNTNHTDSDPLPSSLEAMKPIEKHKVRIGLASSLVSLVGFQRLKQVAKADEVARFDSHGHAHHAPPTIELVPLEKELIDIVWKKEGSHPGRQIKRDSVFVHDQKYAGKEVKSKLNELRKEMLEHNVRAHVISDLSQIAWLFNLRGSDFPYTPLFTAYALVTLRSASLFIDKDKLQSDAKKALKKRKIDIKSYDDLCVNLKRQAFIGKRHGRKMWLDPSHTSYRVFACSVAVGDARNFRKTGEGPEYVHFAPSPLSLMKAIKNAVELEGMRQSHIRDGAALTTYLAWLSAQLSLQKPLNETSAAAQLAEFRAMQKEFFGLSFPSISAVGPHSALPHYHPHPESASQITADSIYLIDSGGQYHDGTTDVTRTVHFGSPNKEEKTVYTRVLQGTIALAQVTFPEGTAGPLLDVLARAPLWHDGADFNHGTGHGIGSFLNVHEGPFAISRISQRHLIHNIWGARQLMTGLRPGMTMSNEPGDYMEGKFGVRIENIMAVVNDSSVSPFEGRSFCKFETLTMVPLDPHLIDVSLLSASDIKWINNYHATVKAKLTPVMESLKSRSPAFETALAYLSKTTEPISA